MSDVQCKVCLTSRTGDVAGQKCGTPGCTGILEEIPEFSTLVDVLPEPMTCGRRSDNKVGFDRWQKFKSNGNRVCSYCGSLHPDDFWELVKLSAQAPDTAEYGSVVEIEPSDKSYKIYVNQPGVRNAHEGGIKFYVHHLYNSEGVLQVSEEQNKEYSLAVKMSNRRFAKHLYGVKHGSGEVQSA